MPAPCRLGGPLWLCADPATNSRLSFTCLESMLAKYAVIPQQILNLAAELGAIATACGQPLPMLWADAKCEFISEQGPFISSVGTFVTFTNAPLASYVFFPPRGIFRVFCPDQTQKSMRDTVASMQQRIGKRLTDLALKHRRVPGRCRGLSGEALGTSRAINIYALQAQLRGFHT
jgi:hypothetical protein